MRELLPDEGSAAAVGILEPENKTMIAKKRPFYFA
jgi:hypothetical protein